MTRRKKILLGGGSIAAVALTAAAAFALVPHTHRFDADGDGRITPAEVRQGATQRFAQADADRDGRLTAEELPRGRGGRHGRRGGHGRHDGDRGDLFEAASPPAAESGNSVAAAAAAAFPEAMPRLRGDSNGDGALDLREYRVRTAARFVRADLNRDNVVDSEEARALRGRGRHR